VFGSDWSKIRTESGNGSAVAESAEATTIASNTITRGARLTRAKRSPPLGRHLSLEHASTSARRASNEITYALPKAILSGSPIGIDHSIATAW
jgi:hypothetical protein